MNNETAERIRRVLEHLTNAKLAAADLVLDSGGPAEIEGCHRHLLVLIVQAEAAALALEDLLAAPPEQDA